MTTKREEGSAPPPFFGGRREPKTGQISAEFWKIWEKFRPAKKIFIIS